MTWTLVYMQALGLLLLGSGVLAAAGSRKRSTHLMIASLTLSCLGMLLAFEFTAEVGHLLPILYLPKLPVLFHLFAVSK